MIFFFPPKILSGYRHSIPYWTFASGLGYLIERAWAEDPSQRPTAGGMSMGILFLWGLLLSLLLLLLLLLLLFSFVLFSRYCPGIGMHAYGLLQQAFDRNRGTHFEVQL